MGGRNCSRLPPTCNSQLEIRREIFLTPTISPPKVKGTNFAGAIHCNTLQVKLIIWCDYKVSTQTC